VSSKRASSGEKNVVVLDVEKNVVVVARVVVAVRSNGRSPILIATLDGRCGAWNAEIRRLTTMGGKNKNHRERYAMERRMYCRSVDEFI